MLEALSRFREKTYCKIFRIEKFIIRDVFRTLSQTRDGEFCENS